MTQRQVLVTNKDLTLPNGIQLKNGTEIEIVMDVVYMGGYPLPAELQSTVLNFIRQNKNNFRDETRNW